MKLIIAGGMDFDDKVLAVNSFMELIAEVNHGVIPNETITEQDNDVESIAVRDNPFTEIIIDGTTGDCCIGEFVANFYHIPVKRFITDWDVFGKRDDRESSGYLRNVEMVEYVMSDYKDGNRHSLSQKGLFAKGALLAFLDKKSNGTAHMINIAKQKGLIVKIVYY